jgi:hypothetical protein
MIPIVCKYLTPRGYRGMALFPFVVMKSKREVQDLVFLNHEKIHLRQQMELLVVPFYVLYGVEFCYRWLVVKNSVKAYRAICFEQEAYSNEHKMNYLKDRSWFEFLKYY